MGTSNVLAGNYVDAWLSHDVDTIVAMHAPDGVFCSASTRQLSIGRDEIRHAVATIFAIWPDLEIHPSRVRATPELVAVQGRVHLTQSVPLSIFGDYIVPHGRTVSTKFAAIIPLGPSGIERTDVHQTHNWLEPTLLAAITGNADVSGAFRVRGVGWSNGR